MAQYSLRFRLPYFFGRLLRRIAMRFLDYSIKEKTAAIEKLLTRFSVVSAQTARVYSFYKSSLPPTSRLLQAMRLDHRRGLRLHAEAEELYLRFTTFVGPRTLFMQISQLEEILDRVSSAYDEIACTVNQVEKG